MKLTAEDLIEEFTPKAPTYVIELPRGKKITAKSVASLDQLNGIQKKAQALLKMSEQGAVSPALKPYLPISPAEATIVAQFAEVVIAPKFDDAQVLKMCRQAGPLAAYISAQIVRSMQEQSAEAEIEALDSEKNA